MTGPNVGSTNRALFRRALTERTCNLQKQAYKIFECGVLALRFECCCALRLFSGDLS